MADSATQMTDLVEFGSPFGPTGTGVDRVVLGHYLPVPSPALRLAEEHAGTSIRLRVHPRHAVSYETAELAQTAQMASKACWSSGSSQHAVIRPSMIS